MEKNAIIGVLAGIRKVHFAIKSAIFNSLTKVRNSILEAMRGIGDTITKIFKLITSPFTNTYASFKKSANSLRTTFAQGMRALHVSLADLRSSSLDKVFAIMRKSGVAIPLTFAIIAFLGLRVYDNQISKIEFN
jgi:phage-related protein